MAGNQSPFGICPNSPADFKIAANVVIAGGAGLGTFTAAQTHALMGIGAMILYNGGASTGFVRSKVSQTQWYLVDGNGVAMPNLGATAVMQITFPFASLSAAEAGAAAIMGGADITAGGTNQDVFFPCYCEQTTYVADTTAVDFDGITCDATHEIFAFSPFNLATECNFNHRNTNNGVWTALKYRLELGANPVVDINNAVVSFIHLTGLQIHNSDTSPNAMNGVRATPQATGRQWIEQCVIRMTAHLALNARVRVAVRHVGGISTIRNNVLYLVGTGYSEINYYGIFGLTGGTCIAVGNMCANWGEGMGGPGTAEIYAYNNAFLECTIATSNLTHQDFNVYNIDEGEEHGTLTTQTIAELITNASGSIETWVWYPNEDTPSDLIATGIMLRPEDSADLDHPDDYRRVLETHAVNDYTDGDTFLPGDFKAPRGRWDVGPVAYYPQDQIVYGICPNSGGDFKVAGRCAMLDGIMYTTTDQNHVLMGIGARVIYDGATIATVVGKLSEDRWMVLTLTGAKPADTNDLVLTTIQHPFGSQSTFEAGFAVNLGTADLTTAEMSMHGVCYCEQAGFTADNTALTYDGTTCDDTYQLHVYTPWDAQRQCNFVHRVQAGGVWDVTRYRLEVAGAVLATGAAVEQLIHFEGIQFHMSSAAGAHITMLYLFGTIGSITYFDQCVMRVADVNANWLRTAVRVDQGGGIITNCVVYLIGLNAIQVDFQGLIADADSTMEVFYCTIYGWRTPIVEGAPAVVTQGNNAIIGNSVVCSGITTQDYDVYDINEGEVHGHLTVQADAALFTAAAGGRETWNWAPAVGSDLIFRARHYNNRTADLDYEAGFRSQGIAPDAGALERFHLVAAFGICPNCPANFETGAGTVTLLDGVATFEIPQINVLMGLGADVDYGVGPAHGYVKEMINPFQFVLVTGAGGQPGNAAAQAVNSINHPFASQSAGEAGYAALTGNASLVAIDIQLWLPCYCEQATFTADAIQVLYDGPTCDFGHWIRVWQTFSTVKESIMQHRNTNKGTWDATRYRMEFAAARNIRVSNVAGLITYIEITGMQLNTTGTGAAARKNLELQGVAGSFYMVQSCILRSIYGNAIRNGIHVLANAAGGLFINNIILCSGALSGNANSRGIYIQVKGDYGIYQNTIENFRTLIVGLAGAVIWVKNNAKPTEGIISSGEDVADYNLYREIDYAEANGSLTTQTNAQLFTGYNAANPEVSDWTPGPGSDLIDNGMTTPEEAVEFAYMLQGDLDHPHETEWRPEGIPGGELYDIGPLERKFAGLVQWYNYW